MGRYAVCEIATRMGSLAADCELARACGADAIGVEDQRIAEVGIDAAVEIIERSGLTVSSHMGFVPLPHPDTAALIQAATTIIGHTARLGSPGVLCVAGPIFDLSMRQTDDRVRRQLAELAPIAAAHGVRVMLEPLHPMLHLMSYVHTFAHALDLVGDHPGTGIVVDTTHVWWDARFLDDLAPAIERVATVQVADVPRESIEARQYTRGQLGDGVIPLGELIGEIDRLGYRGFYENEVIGARAREERVEFFTEGRRRLESWIQ